MNVMRFALVSVLFVALSACGPDNEPAKPAVKADTSSKDSTASSAAKSPAVPQAGQADSSAETSVEPAPAAKPEASEQAVKLDLNLKLKPAPKLETDFEPELEPEPVVETPVEKPAVAKPVAEVPKLKLDLRLPKDLVQELNDADTNEYSAERALPPMFAPKDAEPEPFELSGKLLMDETGSNGSHDTIDGAQLQFKFKQ